MSDCSCPVGTSRKATIQDIELVEVCRLASIAACPGYDAAQRQVWLAAEPKWPKLINDTLLVEVEGHIAGFCVATPAELRYLYVHPDNQGKGVGWYLVGQVEQPGMRCDGNLFSGRVLKKRGWVRVGPHRKERDGVVFENAWYELPAITLG